MAAYMFVSWSGVTLMPWPIGIVPIDEPDHLSSGGTMPGLSPGKCGAGLRPKPKRWIQSIRLCAPTQPAILSAHTLDDCARHCRAVSVTGGRGASSWIFLSATWIWYGRLANFISG